MSIFSVIQPAPTDPILGLNEAYKADTRSHKVNLGVGVYLNEQGELPLLAAVREADQRLSAAAKARSYLGIDGLPAYREQVQQVVFGSDCEAVSAGRVVTVQSLGGTGALKIGADFLKLRGEPNKVLISDPSWENHRQLFTKAGYEVDSYRYYGDKGIDFDGMIADLKAAQPGTVILLHACCHNPTGYDLSAQQWDEVIKVMAEGSLLPFVDMAYQGFGEGLVADAAVLQRLLDAGLEFLCSTSFSKTFSLYGERVGSLNIVTTDPDTAATVLSQVKVTIRTNYSNPPTHGAALVATVLADADLKQQWQTELESMRTRIKQLRMSLVDRLAAQGVADMGFVAEQQGMFSYSGLSAQQMERLREEYAIYGTRTGRMCVAALNDENLDYVAASIAAVR
ncbi:MAG: aromatic amino acid aminotransferase [Arachnia propionica]|nr:MAG: aromatic amino acid aminotransferase [Arachnia propionica]